MEMGSTSYFQYSQNLKEIEVIKMSSVLSSGRNYVLLVISGQLTVQHPYVFSYKSKK